jgi:c-di-GMP-binding flagellar brake protein YcgR
MKAMPVQHEQRKYPRLSINGGDYGVRYQIHGADVLDSRLINLSGGGCGLEVPLSDAQHLEMGDVLEGFCLDHPDLPAVPLSVLVMRMLGKVAGKTSGYVLVGVEFQGITPFIRNLIAEHVAAQLPEE